MRQYGVISYEFSRIEHSYQLTLTWSQTCIPRSSAVPGTMLSSVKAHKKAIIMGELKIARRTAEGDKKIILRNGWVE